MVRPSGATTFAYNYDAAGRLINVTRNGVQYAAYTYDANGNRTSKLVNGVATYATFDARDRMKTQGDLDLTYNANGELTERKNRTTGDALLLGYTSMGDLTSATTPDGKEIDYLFDAAGNRVGKKLDGNLTQGLIYSPEAFGPVAELDASNNLKTRFVYARGAHVPDYMVKDGVTYRIITDQLGSVVMVVDAVTGGIAQEIEYGPFGEVLSDSAPGFQPFGYAGGIYDADTGLVHFGAREYDAELGRWTASDPIGFGGGDSNLYGYVLGDPVNLLDPSGLDSINDIGQALIGFGDEVTLGASAKVRRKIGLDNVVDYCSGYRGVGANGAFFFPGPGGKGRLAGRALGAVDGTARKFSIRVMRYKRAGGGGVNIYRNGERMIGLDVHRLGKPPNQVFRPHIDLPGLGVRHWPWKGF